MKTFKEFNNDDVIQEGIINRGFNLAMVFYLAKWLMTPWEKWPAYKLGLIDINGERTTKTIKTQQEKESLTLINKFIISLRKIILKFTSEGMLKTLVTVYIIKSLTDK